MRSRLAFPALLLWLAVTSHISAFAQSTPTVGIPPLSSTAGSPFDVVNLANLNNHFSVPVFSRHGKGVSFSYALNYDSLIWQVTQDSGGALHWTPMPNWGWSGSTQPTTGYVTYSYSDTVVHCGSNNVEKETWTNFVYYDAFGVPHRFGGTVYLYDDPGCGSSHPSMTVHTGDNSGYQIQLGPVTTGEQIVPTTVTAAGGVKFSPPSMSSSGSGTVQDTNGNIITVAASGTATFTDTLGTTALTVSGSAPNPTIYQYTAPGGAASVRVNYSLYTVATNFNILSNGVHIGEYNQSAYLVSSITLPDGSSYSFTYEKTNGSGSTVTGRIASVTLPTGGTVAYSYVYGNCSNVYNCMMSDGSSSNMTRTLGGGTWTYARTLQPGQSNVQQTTTTVIDPSNNYTDLNFSGIYETARTVWSGPRLAPLDYSYTCYNGNFTDSACPTAVVIPPIASRAHNDHANTVTFNYPYSSTVSYYDPYGNMTQEADYDFASPPTLLRSATNIFNPCTPNNICNELQRSTIKNGSAGWVGQTDYGYDSDGNVLSIKRYVTSSSSLTQQYSYNAGGTLATATDPRGTQTTYGYTGTSCNSAFPTSISAGGLTTQYSYDCRGGVALTTTDPNSATNSTSYTDPYFWRPASSTDALGNVTTNTYWSPTQFESTLNFNLGNSTIDKTVLLDSLGRVWLTQQHESPTSGLWDSVYFGYDASGRMAFQTQPFAGPVWTGQNAPQTTWTYDTLGRPVLVTDPGGATTSYSYTANDVQVTVGPAPAGEHVKTHQYEYDALGRLKSVCEVLFSGGLPCGQATAANGLPTAYQYDANSNLTQASVFDYAPLQQYRNFTFDGLGRLTSEQNPETTGNSPNGTKFYVYDTDTTCGSSAGDRVKRTDAAGNVTCYGYDSLHRLTQVTYPQGPNASSTASKSFYYDLSTLWGYTMSNPLGRLTGAQTVLGGNTTTLEAFGYDLRGQVTDYYQQSARSVVPYHMKSNYVGNGGTNLIQGFLGATGTNAFTHALYYAWDGKGRASGIYDGTTATAVWTGTTYNAADQPLGVPGFNGSVVMTENFLYDAHTNRMTNWGASGVVNGVAANVQTGTLFWNTNGTLHQVIMTDTYNSANNNLTCTYGYDDLARLASDSCGTGWSQTITYDGYGSIIKQGNASLNVAYPYDDTNKNNHFLQSATGITYDNMGDVTKDDLSNTYTYDAEGRPVTVNTVSTTFDAFNRAVEQYSGGVATQIVYSPTGQKFSYMTNGQTLKSYVLPMVAGIQVVYNSAGLKYFRQVDWLGTGRFATNASGGVYYDTSYGPAGETFNETGTRDRLFTGQTQDTITGSGQGIYDFLFRQHSPTEGRWLTPDPAGLAAVDITNPQTWNRYAYVGGNPLSRIDPLGLCVAGVGNCPVITNITVTDTGLDFTNGTTSDSSNMSLFAGGGGGNIFRFQLLPTDGPGEGRGGGARRPQPTTLPQPPPQPEPPASSNSPQPKPTQPKQQQNIMSCGSSLAVLSIGAVTTGAAVAGLIYAPELEPEIYEGIEGLLTIQHLSVPAVAPVSILVEGAVASWQNCHH